MTILEKNNLRKNKSQQKEKLNKTVLKRTYLKIDTSGKAESEKDNSGKEEF